VPNEFVSPLDLQEVEKQVSIVWSGETKGGERVNAVFFETNNAHKGRRDVEELVGVQHPNITLSSDDNGNANNFNNRTNTSNNGDDIILPTNTSNTANNIDNTHMYANTNNASNSHANFNLVTLSTNSNNNTPRIKSTNVQAVQPPLQMIARQAVSQVAQTEVIRAGYLRKKGAKRRNWTKRYLIPYIHPNHSVLFLYTDGLY
jgi:hypothetical protein